MSELETLLSVTVLPGDAALDDDARRLGTSSPEKRQTL
jgi:hypothetical protein